MNLPELLALGSQRISFGASRQTMFARFPAAARASASASNHKPLSVAFLVSDFPLLSESFVINQAVGLIERGHKVDIYTLGKRQPGVPELQHGDVERCRLLDRTHRAIAVPESRWRRTLKGVGLLMANFRNNPKFCWRWSKAALLGERTNLLRLLYAAAPLLGKSHDIMHCQFGTIGLTGLTMHRLGAIRGQLVTTFRGYDISQYVRTCGDRVYENLFRKGALFITNCAFFEGRLLELGCDPARLIVLPSGIDCARFSPRGRVGGRDDALRLVTIGRLVEKKGIEYALRAVAKFAAARPDVDVKYTIIGDGPLWEPLLRLIEELRINDAVTMLSWRNHQQIIDILRDSDVFLGPSVTGADGNQDAPINTLKEAMALELPVIATWHGGIPELVQDGVSGLLVPERDADAIAKALDYLANHRHLWARMGRAGRAFVDAHYNLHALNDELVNIYRKASIVKRSPDVRFARSPFKLYQSKDLI